MSGRPPPLVPRPLPGAASKSYNLASAWEKAAPLTDTQQRYLDTISDYCVQRPLPPHLVEDAVPVTSTNAPQIDTDTDQQTSVPLDEVVLHNGNQFYKWVAELETARTSETEEKYQHYAETLNHHLGACGAILATVDGTLSLFEVLREQHANVSAKTKALHDSCEKMVREKDTLLEFADALRNKLGHFEELHRVALDFHKASTLQDSNHYLPLLQRLDDCISYMTTTNPQYAESNMYATKFRQLQTKAMASVRARVAQVLRQAYEKVQQAIRQGWKAVDVNGRESTPEKSPNGVAASKSLPQGAEAAVLYVQFRAVAEPGLKGLLQGLEARSQRPEYAHLLADCRTMYCDVRKQVMSSVMVQRVAEYSKEPLPDLVRVGCAYLMQVCQLEQQLFDHFFPSSTANPSALLPLMDPLCMLLYDAVRPRLLRITTLDGLCELVDILKLEVLNEQLGRRGEFVVPMRPFLSRVLADVQERLTYRGQSYIREMVLTFRPTPADLAYPALLERAARQGDSGTQEEASTSTSQQTQVVDTYHGWYPSVHNALIGLSKLYHTLDAAVFSGLAQDAVVSAAASITAASRTIAKQSSLIDAYLFQIRQLLILREQLAPFDADFAVMQKELDFSHMRDHLRRILVGQASLFSLSLDNALVQFISKGSVRVRENQVDSKRQLEVELKDTCERFIVAVTKIVVEPMLSFITVVTAVRMDEQQRSVPLREQAFASTEKVCEMVGKVRESLYNSLPGLVAKMKLYLHSDTTLTILFKPIKSNIAEAHAQIAALLEEEYTEEERLQVALVQPQELQQLLDSLS